MKFHNPAVLWALVVLIPLVWWYVAKWKNSNPALSLSTVSPFKGMRATFRVWLMHLCFLLQLVSVACLIVALARPQRHSSVGNSTVEGTDIVLALDISSSMLATDLTPNRIEAAKNVARQFVVNREHDNIGVVIFSGESLSLLPLTTDRGAVLNTVESVKAGMLNDGTAIGDGLASAVNRLVSGPSKSKSIILLTDGTNNAGEVAPSTAAKIAAQKGIRVYTVGVGTNGSMQITDPYGFSTTTLETKIDEEALRGIASSTGGKYFRATDSRTLRHIFDEIDKLEKSKIKLSSTTTTEEGFTPWLIAAFAAFMAMIVIEYTVLRRIP